MAEYIITIKDDDDFGIVVNLSGPPPHGPAARLAFGLVNRVPKIIQEVAAACDCDKCRAARERLSGKPTLH